MAQNTQNINSTAELLAWCGDKLQRHLESVAGIATLDTVTLNEAAQKAKELGYELNIGWLKREFNSTAKKIRSVVDCRDVNPLRAAAYGHDIGKAIAVFQRRLMRDPSCKYVNLRGHEVWSAWALYHAVVAAGAPEDCAVVIATGAALHHSPRWMLMDLLTEPVPQPADMSDIRVLAALAAEAVGVEEALVYAFLRRDYLTFTPLANLRLRLTTSKNAVWGELLAYAVSMADDVDTFLNRPDKRTAVLKPYFKEL